MSRTVIQAVTELLLALPETEETRTHGTPTFRAAGKTYAYIAMNHHGDGRAAIWLSLPAGAQQDWVSLDSMHYFIPPYVGPKGWVGVDIGGGLPWPEIAARVFEAWQHAAPVRVREQASSAPDTTPPDVPLAPEDINPWLGEKAQALLAGLADRCRGLPETVAENEKDSATWRAGKKVFVRGLMDEDRLQLLFHVGVDQQAFLIDDPRYRLPMYYANAGWIQLDVHDAVNWKEIESLLDQSYRHFALKRMLKALDGG